MANFYMSLQSTGVDTKEFYQRIGFTISDVSKGTGVSRAALSRVPLHESTEETAQKALQFMERENRQRYIAFIEKNTKELDTAWKQYLQSEIILEQYRNEYQVERKYQRLERFDLVCRKEVEKLNGSDSIL